MFFSQIEAIISIITYALFNVTLTPCSPPRGRVTHPLNQGQLVTDSTNRIRWMWHCVAKGLSHNSATASGFTGTLELGALCYCLRSLTTLKLPCSKEARSHGEATWGSHMGVLWSATLVFYQPSLEATDVGKGASS